MGVLSRTTHKARVEHFCDRCCEHIHPGQIYERCVIGTERGIDMMKTHIDPECDFPPDIEDETREADAWDREQAALREKQPLAA